MGCTPFKTESPDVIVMTCYLLKTLALEYNFLCVCVLNC